MGFLMSWSWVASVLTDLAAPDSGLSELLIIGCIVAVVWGASKLPNLFEWME